MSEWRSRPPQRMGISYVWVGVVTRTVGERVEEESCHNGSHFSAEAARACSRRKVRRLNRGAAR